MSSAAILGAGTALGYAAVPPVSYTALAEVIDITPPEIMDNDVKVSNHATAETRHEYTPGWEEPGVLSAVITYAKAEHATVRGLRRVKKTWKITYPDGSTDVFTGYLHKIGNKTPLEDRFVTNIEIKVNSDITFTAAA